MRRLLAALGRGALLALLGAAPAAARAGGPPAATVDGQAIPRERLERFVERYAAARGRSVGAVRSPSAYRILVREALQALVDEELLGQEAVRRGLSPPPAEVAAAVAGLQARHPTPAAFDAWLASEGLRPGELEGEVRRRLAVQRLVEAALPPGAAVTDEEIEAHWAAHQAQFTTEAGLLPASAVREPIRARILAERRDAVVRRQVAALRASAVIRIRPPYREEGDP